MGSRHHPGHDFVAWALRPYHTQGIRWTKDHLVRSDPADGWPGGERTRCGVEVPRSEELFNYSINNPDDPCKRCEKIAHDERERREPLNGSRAMNDMSLSNAYRIRREYQAEAEAEGYNALVPWMLAEGTPSKLARALDRIDRAGNERAGNALRRERDRQDDSGSARARLKRDRER